MSLIMPTEKIMIFIDGENLALRYGSIKKDHKSRENVIFEPGIFVWLKKNLLGNREYNVVRKYYYTCVQGDDPKIMKTAQQLKEIGIEEPRVFKKGEKGRKQVDIALAVDMLTHAHRKNYDTAILVAGDEDYVPLVEAVKLEGRRVELWFFDCDGGGLNPLLKLRSDEFKDITKQYFCISGCAQAAVCSTA